MTEINCLNDIEPGQTAKVRELLSTGSIRRRLLDIGLIENTEVECLGRSPAGDPSAFLIRGAVIAIRREACRNILIVKERGGKEWVCRMSLSECMRSIPD